MRFALKAVAREGDVETLQLQALDRAGAVRQAESRGYTVLSVRQRWRLLESWHRDTPFPLVLFSQELLVLLEAGLPLVDSIETLATKEGGAEFGAVLQRVTLALRQGRSLSAALQEMPHAFSPVYVATVRASERTSDLRPALSRYIAYQGQVDALRKQLLNASIYPLLLLSVGGLVSLFLMLYVVPRFSRIYEERTVNVPFFSKLLLGWGQLVEGHAAFVFAIVAGAIACAAYALRSTRVRAALGELLSRSQAIGERLKLYQLARFYRTTGMLLRGGVPLVSALDMGAELLNPALRERLAAARRAISEGRGISASMEANGLVTTVALRMLVVGEQSGKMDEMMDRIATFHDEEIARWVGWFTRLFEPLLMAAIGIVIGAIVIMMYLPIFELAGSLQ